MIIQTNTFICEKCGKIESKSEDVGMFDDPVVCYPGDDEWDYKMVDDKELLLCPNCIVKVDPNQ